MSREAGKGDTPRPTDKPNYDKNWDKIKWNITTTIVPRNDVKVRK